MTHDERIEWALEQDLPVAPKLVLLVLTLGVLKGGSTFFATKTLAQKCSMEEREARLHLDTLVRERLITRRNYDPPSLEPPPPDSDCQ